MGRVRPSADTAAPPSLFPTTSSSRRRRRSGKTRATQTGRRSHIVASTHRHLLRARRSEPDCGKANVLFFARKPAAEKPWTEKLWIYDLRTNKHFTLKENPLKRSDLDDFVTCYNPKNRHERKNPSGFGPSPTKTYLSATNSTSTSSGLKTKASKTAPTSPIPTSSPPRSSKTSKPPSPSSPRLQLT